MAIDIDFPDDLPADTDGHDDLGPRFKRTDETYSVANNPFILAETNLAAIKGRIKIRSVVGTDDFTLDANKAFDARLTSLGIPHDFKIVPHVSHGYKEYYEILDFSFFKTIATTM